MARRVLRVCACVAVTAVMTVGLSGNAQAAFPGQNGRLTLTNYTFSSPIKYSIRTVNSDGTDEQEFLSHPPNRRMGGWSPDGKRLAYQMGVPGKRPELAVVNADGTGNHAITNNNLSEFDPEWSADGTKITFWAEPVAVPGEFNFHIFVVDAAGGPITQLTDTGINRDPVWSPDGTKIAWQGTGGLSEIWTMNPDGSGKQNITDTSDFGESEPDWSPDGTRIAFRGGNFSGEVDQLRVMNADGTDQVVIADPSEPVAFPQWSPDGEWIAYMAGASVRVVRPDGTDDTQVLPASQNYITDWAPVPINGYPRPRSAAPVRVSLVPAYAACTSPDRVHGPPLEADSCSPPDARSEELTLGTLDSNGEASNAEGYVRYEALVGNPATPADESDLRIAVALTDVYEQGTFADYAGELRARSSVRITDKLNHPYPGGPQAGTVTDVVLGMVVPCAPTPASGVGATCEASTTADALAPGTVVEGRRAVWELGEVQVEDGGADADADSTGDNTLFMTQGLFVP